jgi:hypothetical protein
MSETTNTTAARATRLTVARRAGLFLVGSAGALTFTGAFAGNAAAFTPPAPGPSFEIVDAPQQPQPPVVPGIIVLPSDPGPGLDGPGEIAQPVPTPEPHPAPGPQGPGDLGIPEDGPGLPGPDDFSNGEDDGPGLPGPDDFSNGEDDGPGLPGPDDFSNGEDDGPGLPGPDDVVDATPDTTVPGPEVDTEVEDAPVAADEVEVLEETAAAADAQPEELAFTGGDTGALVAGVVLLGAGGAALAGAMVTRRRRQVEA